LNQRQPTDHTEGSIIKSILTMGLPSMIGFGAGNLYALIDTYWLSRLGPEPVAAITVLGPFLWVIHSANMIVGTGSVAIISRRYGEKDFQETEMSIKETIVLKWVVALFFGIIGFILTPIVLDILGASEDVMEIGTVYGRIIFIGLGFNFATYSVFTAMRGVANPNLAMILMISLSGLNIALDPIMIFGWGIIPAMGVAGAAWASVISYALAFIVGMIFFYTGGTNIRLRLKNSRPLRWSTMWKILKIGVPAGIGSVSFAGARLVVMPMITVFGTGVVAAYGVSQQISHIGIMLLVGIGLGMSALIGHNLGAGKKARARETARQAMYLATGIMTFLGLLTFVFAYYIMRMFFEDPQIIEYGIDILRILALGFPLFGMHIMMENIYTGVGENRPPMFINILHAWIIEIPAIYITTRMLGFDQNAVWWSITGATVVSVSVFYMYFRNGKWLDVKV
jgi:putative MATE family efflux protein